MVRRGTNGLKLWVADGRRPATAFVDRSPCPEPHESVGDFLRLGRESRGESVDRIAGALKLRRDYVVAIEEGRWQDVPGRPYVHGYVRAYAEHLAADADAVLARLRGELAGLPSRQSLRFPEPFTERRMPANVIMAACVCLSLGGYFVWYQSTSPERMTDGLLAFSLPEDTGSREHTLRPFPDAMAPSTLVPVGERNAAAEADRLGAVDGRPLPAPAELAATLPPTRLTPLPGLSGNGDGISTDGVEFPGNLQPVRRGAGPAQAAALPYGMTADGSVASAIPEGSAPATAERGVVLQARGKSWVEIRARRGGEVVLSRILNEGDSYTVPDRPGLLLTTGNAGQLDIVLDGEAMPSLGANGAVVRGIELDRDSLLAGRRAAGG